MMQPIDPLSQLALCCGFGGRRRGFKMPKNYFYGPPAAHLDTGTNWAVAGNPYGPPQAQPYILLTQPVIIASNPAPNQANTTMALVQHAQTAPDGSTFPTLSIIGNHSSANQHQSLVSSQYAIYSTSAALNANMVNPGQSSGGYEPQHQLNNNNNNLNTRIANQSTYLISKPPLPTLTEANKSPIPEKRVVTLSSEVFRQIELIEKQVDLSMEMELIEMHGIVITRALDPYSLMPHLSEPTLRRYNSRFLTDNNFVIKFIEIIKRPGQTLGLYIRSVRFGSPQGTGSRVGLVITKIDNDSPVYNSQVLHVGDEILSVNLVDIQGMSIDDVVIIMSIPRRLVLALRVPRDRDQLLSMNLMQQHIRSSLERRLENNNFMPQAKGRMEMLSGDLKPKQTQYSTLASMGDQHDPTMLYSDAQVDELRREMSQRFLSQDQELHLARPARVLSALQMSEFTVRPDQFQSNDLESNQPRRYSSIDPWQERNFDRFNGSRNLDHASMVNFLGPMATNQPDGSRTIIPLSSDEFDKITRLNDGNENLNDFVINPKASVDPNEQAALNMCESSSLADKGQVPYSSINETTPSQGPSTLLRRTLPTRPNALSSPTTVKPPVLNNLRLADTPEQSSYFSSSIDAINRELKNLRQQRMALSNNEYSTDSIGADF